MSDDLVNQLTLNFLISKNQLQKLNKRMKDDTDKTQKSEKTIYEHRIKQIFNDLFINNPPNDLLYDVKNSFDLFIEKTIYYLKAHDKNNILENERKDIIHNDIDFEKEEKNIENGNYREIDNNNDSSNDESNDESNNESNDESNNKSDNESAEPIVPNKKLNNNNKENNYENNIVENVRIKYKKNAFKSTGVQDIQHLPLDWFQSVRQNYKLNKVITRKKDVIIGEAFDSSFRDEKRKYQ